MIHLTLTTNIAIGLKSNDQDKTRYTVTCNNLLSSLDINNDAFTCDYVKCTNMAHIDAVTNSYNDVTRCLNNAVPCSIPQTVVTGTHHTNVQAGMNM